MTTQRTETGRQVEAGLGEVLAHVQGETRLPCRIVDDPAAERAQLSRQSFADRFGLDAPTAQDRGQDK